MNYSVEELQEISFPQGIRGYKKEKVSRAMSRIIDDYKALRAEVDHAQAEIKLLRESLGQYKAIENSLKNALIVAQRAADDIKKNARESAESIIANAELEKQNIVEGAKADTILLNEQLDELRRETSIFIEKLDIVFSDQLAQIRNSKQSLFPAQESEELPLEKPDFGVDSETDF